MATIFDVPPSNTSYDLTGKKVMVHDLTQPEGTSTEIIDISYFSTKIRLPAGTVSYQVPAGVTITRIWFWGGATDTVIGVGRTSNENNLFEAGNCPAGGDLPFDGNKGFRNATTIYFNGIASDIIPIIYRQ